MLQRFLDHSATALKICGVTRPDDARRLVDLGVDALGVNFWPKSKRFLAETDAGFLRELAGRILRVGVFVNPPLDQPRRLVDHGLIDAVQLHGDESPAEARCLREVGIPVIKALGIRDDADLEKAEGFPADALLLDAHAPGVYGGTGRTIDWEAVADFIAAHPERPVILAGGITPDNAADAVARVGPVAIDIASGAESAPGIKDFDKVSRLLDAVRQAGG